MRALQLLLGSVYVTKDRLLGLVLLMKNYRHDLSAHENFVAFRWWVGHYHASPREDRRKQLVVFLLCRHFEKQAELVHVAKRRRERRYWKKPMYVNGQPKLRHVSRPRMAMLLSSLLIRIMRPEKRVIMEAVLQGEGMLRHGNHVPSEHNSATRTSRSYRGGLGNVLRLMKPLEPPSFVQAFHRGKRFKRGPPFFKPRPRNFLANVCRVGFVS